jgi:hypothetical protein
VKTFFPERLAIKIINQKTDGEKGRPVITGRIKVRNILHASLASRTEPGRPSILSLWSGSATEGLD